MKKKYLVIGNPIEHSLSPELHNYWIKSNNLDAIYEKKKLEVSELENLVSNIKEMKLNGANVTVPFKKKIIPYLDQLSIEAKKTQSVNTIYLEENKVIGHNTDIDGFELGIKKTNLPLWEYRNNSFYSMRTDSLDRFGTKVEKRFSKKEIEKLMYDSGLIKLDFSLSAPYWCVVGYKS